MEEIGGIKVRIIGDDSDLQNKLKGAAVTLGKWSVAAASAAAAATTAFTVMGLRTVDANAKLARSLGTTIDSLQGLRNAAGDSGLAGLENSLNRLNRRLGAAESGTGAATKTVQALNLDLKELASLDVDERVAVIADAIRDSGVSMQQAARYAQDLGFQQREAAAFFMQGGGAIRAYREEVDLLGLSVSAIDAAQIEAANDAMVIFGQAVQSVQQRLAIESAPYLKAVSEEIEAAWIETDGFSETMDVFFDKTLKLTGILADAFRMLQIGFSSFDVVIKGLAVGAAATATSIVGAFDLARRAVPETINAIIDALNHLPGVDLDKIILNDNAALARMRDFSNDAKIALQDSVYEMRNLTDMPLPSEVINEWSDNVKTQAQEAAEAVVAAQKAMFGKDEEDGEESSDQLTEAQKLALEAAREIYREHFASLDELKAEQLEKELEALALGHELLETSEKEYLDKKAMLEEKYANETQMRAREAAKAEIAIEEAKNKAKIAALTTTFGNLSSLMNTENKKLFEIGKVAAIAQAAISTYQGAAQALKDVPYPFNIAAAASVGIAGAVQIANIKATSFSSGGGAVAAGAPGGSTPSGMTSTQQAPAQPEQQGPAGGTLTVQGLSASSLFSGDAVAQIAEELLDYQRRGGAVLIQG